MDPNAFTYYAFVSYSHKDEKWARWIQSALERYRLPAAVRKEAGKPLPERIRPVFRDATDLGVGKLVDNLRQELEQSKFLIVVCSPNSARPNAEGKHWVDEEVVHFCELGRADRIIPVIVGGTKETAYCPKLEEEDILGLDATKHPRERILNDLVAKILGLRPDELWRREERRIRGRREQVAHTRRPAVSGGRGEFGVGGERLFHRPTLPRRGRFLQHWCCNFSGNGPPATAGTPGTLLSRPSRLSRLSRHRFLSESRLMGLDWM